MRRFLISGGYFGPNPSSSGNLTKEQTFLGRLLTIFQCGINYNQHGETSNFFSLRPICSSKYFQQKIAGIYQKHFSGIYQAEGVIEAGKKLPIVDVGSAFYPNMVSCMHHQNILIIEQLSSIQLQLITIYSNQLY